MSQDETSASTTPAPLVGRLESWKEIADYLGKGVTTVRRWEREEGLPVRRQEHLKRGSVVAFRHEVDAWLLGRTTPLPEEPAPLADPEPKPVTRGIFRPAALAVAVGIAAAVLAIAAVWRPAWDHTELGTVPLTSAPGEEGHIAFGPGGAYAYAHGGEEVLVHAAGAGAGKVIWKPAGKSPCCVSWSPDGKWLAISQYELRRDYEFVVVTPTGQPVAGPFEGGPELTWSPDNQGVVFARRLSTGPSRIYERRLADGHTRQLSFPPEGSWGDIAAAFSPDGQGMAIVRYAGAPGNGDVYLSAPGSREARRLTKIGNWIIGLDWLPDGRHLIASTSHAGRMGLFRLDTEGQTEPVLLQRTEGRSTYPRATVQPDGRWRIGYSVEFADASLTVLDLATGRRWTEAQSSRGEENPAINESGAIVFRSDRRGGHELWVCPVRDCASPQRITVNTEEFVDAMPRWSPDGRRLAFAQRLRGSPSILVVNADGTDRRVLSTGFQEGSPAWSADGRTVFFRSNRGGSPQIWRIDADGSGTPRQVTLHGGVECHAAADGQSLLFLAAADNAPLTRLSLRDGSETVIRGLPPLIQARWTLAGNLIYYFAAGSHGELVRLKRFDLASGRLADVHSGDEVEWPLGIGANRAGMVVWSSRGPMQSDLIALEFRPGKRFNLAGWW